MIECKHRAFDLQLRHTFRLSRGASDQRTNLFVELHHDDHRGLGEAAPIARYGQDHRSAAAAVERMSRDLEQPEIWNDAARRVAIEDQPAAEAAIDMALLDLAGKRLGVPVYQLLGLDSRQVPPTSFTIGIDTPDVVAAKVRQASDFEFLKIKLGSEDDKALLEAVRDISDQPLRIDANEGWTVPEALELLPWLERMGVEMIEQPLPAADLAGARQLRKHSSIPIFADESVGRAIDIPRLAGAFDGINIKLMKCGGPSEALRMIHTARACGLQVMLGCMVESSLAITAAAHLSPLADHADLDGHLLISNDPYRGVTLQGGRLELPEAPGLGVVEADVVEADKESE